MLPWRTGNRGLPASTMLHGVALVALIWAPSLFPASVVVIHDVVNKAEVAEAVPLVLPKLPPLAGGGSGSRQSSQKGPAAAAAHTPAPEPPLEQPDYVNAQQIVSLVPNAVNRVQTIQRPDLVRPPEMKFPIRLQSMVSLPAPAAPVLNVPPPPEETRRAPAAAQTAEEIPAAKSIETAVLTLAPKRASIVHPKAAQSSPAVAPNLRMLAKVQGASLKAIVVVNAVNVEPDSAVPLPDAQLAGLFVVGPSPDSATATKAPSAGSAHSSADGSTPSANSEGSSRSSAESGKSGSSGSDPSGGVGGKTLAAVSIGAAPGTGSGSGSGPIGKAGSGTGTGSGAIPGSGSGSSVARHSAGNGSNSGITISGGIPGRGAAVAKADSVNRSYGLMIISGGSSGGASRDLGVFGRTETVYNVTIPMGDAGGGPDWTMQYALLNRAQAGAGLLVPPFAQKKVAASLGESQLAGTGLVFIAGIIDESGKLQAVRPIRVEDARSQAAIRALQQWEFLPAQLDGKPVASKVLMGVSVVAAP